MGDQQDARRLVHKALTEIVSDVYPPPESDGDCVLRSWALVASVTYADGAGQVYRLSSDAVGEDELNAWEREGLLHYGLYNFQPGDGE